MYDRESRRITTFVAADAGTHALDTDEIDLEHAEKLIGQYEKQKLEEDVELLDGASEPFDMERVRAGELSPVFFGSAADQLWRGKFSAALFEDDHVPAAQKERPGNCGSVPAGF